MADQRRWFKFWCSAPSDDDIQALPVVDRWAWAVFGAYTKLHGTRGRVTVRASNVALAAEMGVPIEAMIAVIKRLPHMSVEEGISANGSVAVTWKNWQKYQEDHTVAERVARLRSKKRGEERRREETRREVVGTRPKDRIGFDSTAGRLTGIEVADREAWSRAYPGTSIDAVIADAENFLRDHHADYRDFSRFVRGQFQRAQRRGQGRPTVADRPRLNDTWAGKTSGDVKL